MKIAVIHGPNLNMLGKRNPKHYGTLTLNQMNQTIIDHFSDIDFIFLQSNHEGEIIDFIQTLTVDALVINAAAYTHTSVAIRDALELLDIMKVEVHLSDITNREDFRKINYIKDVVDQTFYGKKEQSYLEAIEYILAKKR